MMGDPLWLNDHEYLVDWDGRIVLVDIEKLRPLPIPSFPDAAVSFGDMLKRIQGSSDKLRRS